MSIKDQAERLLNETGLADVLRRHGEMHVTGSYLMDMMVWNDLDIYLQADEAHFEIYEMIASVNSALRPVRFDGIVRQEEKKFFYGVETFFLGERWNVDIWVKDEKEISASIGSCEEFARRVKERPELREAIMEIKKGLIERGMYGFDKHPHRHYHSGEIYTAVMNENIRSLDDFLRRYPLEG